MKLLYDVSENKWYNENGETFPVGQPFIPYGNSERVEIQLYAEVAGTNTDSDAVAEWTKYTEFSDGGYGAILATDNNFLHWFKAALATDLPSGTVTADIDVATDRSVDDIASSGNLYFYDGNGVSEAVAYSARVAIDGGVRFTPTDGETLENSYTSGAQVDLPEMLYAEAAMLTADSDPANGLFVFDFVCDSPKLRNKMQYDDVETLSDCKGLELTVFQTASTGIVSIRKRFRCSSFRIVGGIADVNTGVTAPPQEQNKIVALLYAVLAHGMEVQASENGTDWSDLADVEDPQTLRWFRFRVKESAATWSAAIPLIEGAKGEDGKDGEDCVPFWNEDGLSVAWDDITGKPSSYPPSPHTHAAAEVYDRARQVVVPMTSANTLYLDKDIVMQTANVGATLAIDVANVLDAEGNAYTGQEGDVFTWELWVPATQTITNITCGGNSHMMKLPNFPETLALVDGGSTRHVFTVRGIYSATSIHRLKFLVNYAYSEAL